MTTRFNARSLACRLLLPSLLAMLVLGTAFVLPGGRSSRPEARPSPVGGVDAGGVATQPRDEAPARSATALRYRWEAGEERSYAFKWQQGVRLTSSRAFAEKAKGESVAMSVGDGQEIRLEVCGDLLVRSYGATGENVLLGHRFRDLDIRHTIEGQGPTREASEDDREDRQREVLVLVGPRGDIVEMRFAPDMDPQVREDLRSVLGLTQFLLSEDDATSWTTQETDSFGISEARHVARPGAVEGEWFVSRQRTYRRLHLRGQGAADAAGVSVIGGTEVVFSEGLGLLTTLRTEESVHLSREDIPYEIQSTLRASMHLADRTTGGLAQDAEDGARGRLSTWVPVRGFAPLGGKAIAERYRKDRERDRARTLSLDRLVSDLEGLCARDCWNEDALQLFDDLRILFENNTESVGRTRGSCTNKRIFRAVISRHISPSPKP